MTYKLVATISHPSFGEPVVKELYYQGETLSDIMAQIEAPKEHLHNLQHYGKAAFKDARGVKHKWQFALMPELN